jgi:hypothetical protein
MKIAVNIAITQVPALLGESGSQFSQNRLFCFATCVAWLEDLP